MGHAGHLAGLCCGQGLVCIQPFGLVLRILGKQSLKNLQHFEAF